MIDFLLIGLLLLIGQLIPIWLIYRQISNDRSKSAVWWGGSLIYTYISALIMNMYWWLPLILFFAVYERVGRKNKSWGLIFFRSFYPVFIETLLVGIVTLFLYALPYISYVNDNEISWIIISIVSAFLLHYLSIKFFKIDFSILEKQNVYVKNKILIPSNIALSVGFIPFLILYIKERSFPTDDVLNFQTILFFSFDVLIFISLLLFLSMQGKRYFQRELQIAKEEQYQQLKRYIHEIEELYLQIRGFRHDFGNILASLGESINTGDIEEIRETYQDILVKANLDLSHSNYNIAELSNISNTAIKSLLSSKVMQAEDKGLHVNLEIKTLIASFVIETLDYVRVISLLIDNAIEAAELSKEKKVEIAIFSDDMKVVTIISNSVEDDKIVSIEKMFNSDFSTKGMNRGLGLYNVKIILGKYTNAILNTQVDHHKVSQTLILNEGRS